MDSTNDLTTFTTRVVWDNPLGKIIHVLPWPDDPTAAHVAIRIERYNPETDSRELRAFVDRVTLSASRRWASALLYACDLAERELKAEQEAAE